MRALLDLSDQLGPGTCQQFVGNYIRMWDSRYSRLVSAQQSADLAEAMDVVLSIKTASQMAGAGALARLAAEAQHLVLRGDLSGLGSLLEPLEECGQQTIQELRQAMHTL